MLIKSMGKIARPSPRTELCREVLRLAVPALGLALLALPSLSALAATPRISLIERLNKDQVTLHFDTEANRTYRLQYSIVTGTNRFPAVTWSNLYVAPTLPFPNHYVVVDTRTNVMRFYRLEVSP